MDHAERRRLVGRNTAEVVTDEELDGLLADDDPTVYIGY
ncbi:tyrosine--tRNA ligase, partial [Halobacteriales archaeon SW_12_67_38]